MITFTITNKNRPKATVVMLVSLYGKQYKRSIGVGVPEILERCQEAGKGDGGF